VSLLAEQALAAGVGEAAAGVAEGALSFSPSRSSLSSAGSKKITFQGGIMVPTYIIL